MGVYHQRAGGVFLCMERLETGEAKQRERVTSPLSTKPTRSWHNPRSLSADTSLGLRFALVDDRCRTCQKN